MIYLLCEFLHGDLMQELMYFFLFLYPLLFLPVLWQVECAVHNPEPHVNTESTADTPVVGHGCVWVRHFSYIVQKRNSVIAYVVYSKVNSGYL